MRKLLCWLGWHKWVERVLNYNPWNRYLYDRPTLILECIGCFKQAPINTRHRRESVKKKRGS